MKFYFVDINSQLTDAWNQSLILFSVFLFLVSCDSVHIFSIQNKSDRGKY